MRLKAGAFLVFSCGVLAIAGCGGGGTHYYSRSATEACLLRKAELSDSFGPAPIFGDLDVVRTGHDLYLAFGESPSDARHLAKDVGSFHDVARRVIATNRNVAYWTTASVLTSADRKLINGCLW
jgi:hypothetical protein